MGAADLVPASAVRRTWDAASALAARADTVCVVGVWVLMLVVVEGGARIPNHAHYRGRTPSRLSLTDVAPGTAASRVHHLRDGGARYP